MRLKLWQRWRDPYPIYQLVSISLYSDSKNTQTLPTIGQLGYMYTVATLCPRQNIPKSNLPMIENGCWRHPKSSLINVFVGLEHVRRSRQVMHAGKCPSQGRLPPQCRNILCHSSTMHHLSPVHTLHLSISFLCWQGLSLCSVPCSNTSVFFMLYHRCRGNWYFLLFAMSRVSESQSRMRHAIFLRAPSPTKTERDKRPRACWWCN